MMPINLFMLGSAWVLYCVLHSILAHQAVKNKLCRVLRLGTGDYRILYNVVALISLAVLLVFHFSVPGNALFRNKIFQSFVGPAITFTGLTGMVICIVKYFRQLSGLKIKGTKAAVLETGGMHRLVRHPLYLFTFIFLIGVFLQVPLPSNLIALIIIISYTVIGIRFEEEKLIREFGEQYITYKKSVPMLIPFF